MPGRHIHNKSMAALGAGDCDYDDDDDDEEEKEEKEGRIIIIIKEEQDISLV